MGGRAALNQRTLVGHYCDCDINESSQFDSVSTSPDEAK